MKNENPTFVDVLLAEAIPDYIKDCPLVFGWCRYNGRVYFADLNWEESEKRQKPVFDLAYCATKALNGIYLIQRGWDKNKFTRWKNYSNW